MSSSSSSSADTCNSRSLSWFLNSCIPKSPSDLQTQTPQSIPGSEPEPPISSLPDDLLLACLARAPLSSLPSLSAVSRRFSVLLSSPLFFPLRRSLSPLSPNLFSLSPSSSSSSSLDLIAAVLPLNSSDPSIWNLSSLPLPFPLSHPSFLSLNNAVFLIGRGSAVKFDTWTARISPISPTLFPRKKFAAAVLDGKIYVAGGSSRTSAVEIYDPQRDTWRILTESPTRRYGCIGASAGEMFYVIGGLRIGDGAADPRAAHATAGTVDAYHVRTGAWWARGSLSSSSRAAVPGGGCIVGACGLGPSLYVIASNAVEFTFWRWQWWERGGKRGGEWGPLEPPPVHGRVGLGGAVRFSCCAVGAGKMAAAVHVSSRGGQNGDFGGSMEGALLVYDVGSGEWSRGPDLPAGFRRAGLVCVEC